MIRDTFPFKRYGFFFNGFNLHRKNNTIITITIKLSETKRLSLANNTSTQVKATGNVPVNIKMDNGYKPVDYTYLRTNLISVAKIIDKNNEIIFKKNEAIVRGMDGRLIARAKRIGNLYYIQEKAEYVNIVNNVNNIVSLKKKKSELKLWHEKLDHLNMKDIILIYMEQKKMATGMPMDNNAEIFTCETCLQGKFCFLPFFKESKRCSRLIEIIHSDVCGPMRNLLEVLDT